MLRQAVTILKLIWVDETASFAGKHYKVENAFCNPKTIELFAKEVIPEFR